MKRQMSRHYAEWMTDIFTYAVDVEWDSPEGLHHCKTMSLHHGFELTFGLYQKQCKNVAVRDRDDLNAPPPL